MAWVLVATRRRWLHVVLVPVGAFAIVAALSLPWGVQNVLDDYVRYHLDKTTDRKPGANFSKLWHTYLRRDTFLARARDPRAPSPHFGTVSVAPTAADRDKVAVDDGGGGVDPTRFLWWWAGIAFVVLLLQDPMFRNHLAALVAPAALLVARYRPPWRVVAVAGLVTLPFQAVFLRPLLLPHDFTGRTAAVVDALRAMPAGAWALSDEPGLVWRAGHATDPFFVDASVLRIESDVAPIRITEDRVVRAAARPRVCAVVITSRERFGSWPDLPARLERLGYQRTVDLDADRDATRDADDRLGLWQRAECRP